jgi:starch synthase
VKILLAASEFFPFFKTGGLADVTGALSQFFSHVKKNTVTVFVPKYKKSSGVPFAAKRLPGNFKVTVGGKEKIFTIFKVKRGRVNIYLIENEEYFGRANFYGTKNTGYVDNDKRFIFFSKAVLEGAKLIGFSPDIAHCHDWQTGLIPVYLKTLYKNDPFYAKTKSVFTIHNLAYQGSFPKKAFDMSGLALELFNPDALEYYGGINFLKSAIVYSDIITTVSPTYAKEALMRREISFGMQGALNSKSKNFYGILNGIDTSIWNPAKDAFIVKKYSIANFKEGKKLSKNMLKKKHNLTLNEKLPLAAIVSRLDYQKGLDIALKIIPRFAGKCQFAILATGNKMLEEKFKTISKEFKGSVFFANRFDETLAHNIYAGADIFLMPSRFEPCGLSQMIALKYGTCVVANKTGGIADTVCGFGKSKKPNGFFTHVLTENAMTDALNAAIICYHNKPLWYNMVKSAMKADFSWDKSVRQYMKLFKNSAKSNSVRKVKNVVR